MNVTGGFVVSDDAAGQLIFMPSAPVDEKIALDKTNDIMSGLLIAAGILAAAGLLLFVIRKKKNEMIPKPL